MDSDYGDELQPREHRAGAWILLVVGLAAIGLGIFQFGDTIASPFRVESNYKTADQLEQERLDAMKTKDTDLDGITDFDETYVFNTSPYLDDSDSDGFTDKEELESGNDPNCPEGKVCGPLEDRFASPEGVVEAAPATDTSQTELEMIDAMLNPTPDQIRQLLIDSGVEKSEVDSLDDETLIRLYQESLTEVQSNSALTP